MRRSRERLRSALPGSTSSNPGVCGLGGTAKLEDLDLDGAVADFNKAIELKKDYAFAYNNRSSVQYKKKNFEAAINDCNTAIGLNPGYGEAYLNRGITKEMLKDFKGACEDFTKAASLGIDVAKKYKAVVCE